MFKNPLKKLIVCTLPTNPCFQILLPLVLGLWSASTCLSQTEPVALFLTWHTDPTTTMVFEWHQNMSPTQASRLYYRKASESNWQSVIASPIPTAVSDRTIYRKTLNDLSPGTRYDFRIDSASQIYSFQTMPSDIDRTPVVFAIGGDTFEGRSKVRRERIDRLQRILSQYHPSFILWSQPLPHHSRTFEHSTEWDDWLDAIKEALIDENGHITPIISAVDHFHPETLTSHEDQPGISTSPIHTAFQSQMSGPIAGANYRDEPRILDFGAYLSLLILAGDSRLVTSPSKFKRIKKLLKHRKHRSHLFVANSPLLYPSSPPTDQSETDPNKEEWISLFDRYKVSLAFDFQDDRYKRTAPLLAGQPAPEGTVYLSDGKSGSTHTASSKMWNPFVEASHSDHNLIFVSLHGTNRFIRTVNAYGKIVDEFPRIFEQPVFEHALSTFLPKGGLTLSAEIAEFQGASYMATDYSGFSRGGFAQFNPEEGSGKVIWQLPVHNTDFFTIRFRYSYAEKDSAYLQFVVNDEIIEDEFLFESTGKENRWEKSTLINSPLQRGVNRLEIRSIAGMPAPRIDRIEILPSVY